MFDGVVDDVGSLLRQHVACVWHVQVHCVGNRGRELVCMLGLTDYGLAGSIWTTDVAHALELSARIQTGTMAINTFGCQPCTPFGGVKRSGIGREGGPEGLRAYLSSQSILLG